MDFRLHGDMGSENSLNSMTDVLRYVIQTDSYSCGFFFMCSLAEFADISEIPRETYRTTGSALSGRI